MSIGFRNSVSLLPAIQATGLLILTPAGLSPAEQTSLRWTHNPAVPIETTDTARRDAIERLGHAMEQWYQDSQPGKPPPGGGMEAGQPTAPGLSAALLRMRHHTRMALLSLDEMSRGPSNRRWGIIERLDARDVIVFVDVAFEALRLAAAVVAETSVGTPAPATPEDRQALKAARDTRQTGLQAISATASVIERIATRILASPPPEGNDDGAIH